MADNAAAAPAPTIQSVNKALRSLIKDLYMVGSYGSQRGAIEAAGYDRFAGLVPSETILTKAVGIVVGLYLETPDEPLHTQLQGLIRDVISLNPPLVSSFNPAGEDLLVRPEFTEAVAARMAAPGPLARVDEQMRDAFLDARAAYSHRMSTRAAGPAAAAGPLTEEDVEAEARAAAAAAAWRAQHPDGNDAASYDSANANAADHADDVKVIKIVASEGVAGAVTDSGKVYVWGSWANGDTSVSPPADLADVKDLALSYDGAIAVKRDGSLVAWGGENGSAEVVIPAGLRLKALYGSEGGFYGIGMDDKIVYLPTTYNQVAIALPDIEVKGLILSENYAWGVAIGLDDSAVAFGPSAVAIPTDIKIKKAILGNDFGLAILMNDRLYAWGERNFNFVTQDNWHVLDVAFGRGSYWVLKDTGLATWYNPRDYTVHRHDTTGLTALAGSTEHILMLDTHGRVSIYNPRHSASLNVPEEILDPRDAVVGLADADADADADVADGTPRNDDEDGGNGNGTPRDPSLYYRTLDQIRYAHDVMRPSFETVEAEVVPKVDGDVFDFSDGEAYESVADYLLEAGGEACLFLYKDHLMAFSKRQLAEKIEDGTVVFYECRQVFPFDPVHGLFGTFEPTDIKKEKYVEIAMNGRFTFPLELVRQLFTSHTIWRIEETPNVLPVTTSWAMAIHGGPVESAVHCQDGTEKRLYKLTPVKFARRAAAAAAPVAPVAKIRRGENVREIDLAAGANVASVKGRYAEAVGVNVQRVRFIFGGKILKNTDAVAPGSMLQAMVRAEGGTRRRRGTRKLSRR